MCIAIIDYGLGNLGSVKNALDKLGVNSIISSSAKKIKAGSGLILPGVGSASEGMKNLKKIGLDEIIIDQLKQAKPFLGICLGMQLLFSKSEEGNVNCLNIIKGTVEKFSSKLKVPQIGWNSVLQKTENKLFKNIPNNSSFYFVNSYYCKPKDKSFIIGETEYGINFCSVFANKNIIATQYHPEKSGKVGQQFIKNWIKQL